MAFVVFAARPTTEQKKRSIHIAWYCLLDLLEVFITFRSLPSFFLRIQKEKGIMMTKKIDCIFWVKCFFFSMPIKETETYHVNKEGIYLLKIVGRRFGSS